MATFTDRDVIDKAGAYSLSELSIISYIHNKEEQAPRFMDIFGITINFEMTEDIFSNTIVGAVTVYDLQDIRSILPLTGMERLSVKFNTPGLPGYDFTEQNGVPFQIYKVDLVKKDPNNDKGQYYKIFFCSPESYKNSLSSVSQAYEGPVEVSIEKILRDKKYLNSQKPLHVEPTKTNAKYVIPSMKPFEAINFLSTQAIAGQYDNAGYLFYETSKGFHCRSIDSLLAMGGSMVRPARWQYVAQVAAVQDSKSAEVKDLERRMKTVIKYEFDRPVDTLANIMGGLYANRLVVHDAFNKTITTHDYNNKEQFAKQFHLEHLGGQMSKDKHILPDVPYNDTNKSLFERPEAHKMVVTETSKVHNNFEFTPTKDTLPKITSAMAGYRNLNLSLLVFGNTSLNAGDVITFANPVMRPTGHNDSEEENPYTSGRYLIMAIKHIVNIEAQRHEMVLKCYKDSVRNAYPSEEDALITGKDKTSKIDIYEEDITELDDISEE